MSCLDCCGAHSEYGEWSAYPRGCFRDAEAALVYHISEFFSVPEEDALRWAEWEDLRIRLVWLRPSWTMTPVGLNGWMYTASPRCAGLIEAWEVRPGA